ncbi:hypothetical protein IQ07DRAFT_498641 [Pyrenochaeta sp. DS3sAY3a]|nr:hypothetical protein IQ07DRAFT_498641 [Pyrenochaeta sp. DS3sAY3a]
MVLKQIQGAYASQHPVCCVQSALSVHNLLLQTQSQLQNTYKLLQTTQSELRNSQDHVESTQEELSHARQLCEETKQQFFELDECHCRLKKDYEYSEALRHELDQSIQRSEDHAEEVARRAEGLVKHMTAKLSGADVTEMPNGQSISGLLLESASNALLVAAMSEGYPQKEEITQLKYVMDQNVIFQEKNLDLTQELESLRSINENLSKQAEESKHEAANLTKALEITREDKWKKARRSKRSISAHST